MYEPRCFPCSLMHLVCRIPLLVIPVALGLILAAPHLYNLPAENVPESMITFSFDDGYRSVYDNAFPILEKYGYAGTVFVITSATGQIGYMSAGHLVELAKKGWEIGSHGVTHRYLTELSDEELDWEVFASREYLKSLGLTVTSFAPPGGKYDSRTIAAVSRYYLCQRISWPDGFNDIPLKEESRYQLHAVSVEAKTTVEEVKRWILKAKEEKKWLILLFHRIDESGDYNWPLRDFEAIVRFAKEQGFFGVSMTGIR